MYELNGLGPCVRDESVNPPGATVPVGFQIALPTSAAGPRRKSSQGFQVKQHRIALRPGRSQRRGDDDVPPFVAGGICNNKCDVRECSPRARVRGATQFKPRRGFQVKQHRMPVDLKPLLAKCVVQVKLLDVCNVRMTTMSHWRWDGKTLFALKERAHGGGEGELVACAAAPPPP